MVTDDILYRRYLSGDEDGLSALMERHGDKLMLYLDGCLHDLHESEDLMIVVFAYLIAKQPRIRDGGFRAYLYRSARHMALRLLSRKRAQLCFSLDALTEEPEARELVEGAVESAERARILRACMAELHADYREALFLVYFEGLSHAETASSTAEKPRCASVWSRRGSPMRTTDERLAAAKRRAEEIKRQERSRRSRIAAVSGAAACLAAILGLALAMPSVTARFSGADYYGGMTASLFTGESLGYLLVGLLAFALGVCVTVLCVRLHERERDEGSEEEHGDA